MNKIAEIMTQRNLLYRKKLSVVYCWLLAIPFFFVCCYCMGSCLACLYRIFWNKAFLE